MCKALGNFDAAAAANLVHFVHIPALSLSHCFIGLGKYVNHRPFALHKLMQKYLDHCAQDLDTTILCLCLCLYLLSSSSSSSPFSSFPLSWSITRFVAGVCQHLRDDDGVRSPGLLSREPELLQQAILAVNHFDRGRGDRSIHICILREPASGAG